MIPAPNRPWLTPTPAAPVRRWWHDRRITLGAPLLAGTVFLIAAAALLPATV